MNELMSEVTDKYRSAVAAFERRRPFFDKHLAMYVGLQYGFQQNSAFPYATLASDDQFQLRQVHNYVQRVVRSAVSSRLQTLLVPGVVPAKRGVMARARAKASHRLMRSFLRTDVFDYEELVRATIGAAILGASWLKTYFDVNVGPFVQDPETGEVNQEGDARTIYVDVYDAIPLMQARTAREVTVMFHRKRVLEEDAKDIFGTGAKFSAPGTNQAGWNNSRNLQDVGQQSGAGSDGSFKAQTFVEIVEMWEQPCKRYPGGRFVAFSGGDLLHAAPLPHKWPWRMLFGDNIVPGGLYPQGSIRPVSPLQEMLNKIESKTGEWLLKLSPKWISSKNNGVDESRLLSDEIELVTFNPTQASRPELVTPDMPGDAMFLQSQRLAGSMDDISGYSGLSQGNAPPNVNSARGMAFLTERETQGRAPDRTMFARTVAGCLKDNLELYRDFVPDGKLLQIFGTTGGDAVIEPFRRADYDFDSEIVIDIFGGPPESPAQRKADALEIANAGGFEDTPAAMRFRSYTNIDSDALDGVPDPKGTHIERNLMEQTALIMGQVERIHLLPEDDDDVHLTSDTEFMVTAEFLTLPAELQDFYRQHVGTHEMQRQQKLARFSEEQQMMQPGAARQAQAGRDAAQPNAAKEPGQESPADGGWGPATPES